MDSGHTCAHAHLQFSAPQEFFGWQRKDGTCLFDLTPISTISPMCRINPSLPKCAVITSMFERAGADLHGLAGRHARGHDDVHYALRRVCSSHVGTRARTHIGINTGTNRDTPGRTVSHPPTVCCVLCVRSAKKITNKAVVNETNDDSEVMIKQYRDQIGRCAEMSTAWHSTGP